MDIDKSKGEIQRDYYDAVNGIVDDIVEEIENGQTDPDDYQDRVSESVDNSEWIIYTWRAMEVLRISQNNEAYTEWGLGAEAFEHGIPWSQLAYAAMEQDVYEAWTSHHTGQIAARANSATS